MKEIIGALLILGLSLISAAFIAPFTGCVAIGSYASVPYPVCFGLICGLLSIVAFFGLDLKISPIAMFVLSIMILWNVLM